MTEQVRHGVMRAMGGNQLGAGKSLFPIAFRTSNFDDRSRLICNRVVGLLSTTLMGIGPSRLRALRQPAESLRQKSVALLDTRRSGDACSFNVCSPG